MTGPRPRPPRYPPRPQLLRHPVERSPERLVLWPRRAGTLLMFVVGAGLLAGGIAAPHHDSTAPWGGLDGVLMLLGGLWFLLTNRPVLVVDHDGIRAPMLRQHDPLAWSDIVGLRRGALAASGTLEVHVWADASHERTKVGLMIVGVTLPIRLKTLLPAVESYRPDHHPRPDVVHRLPRL